MRKLFCRHPRLKCEEVNYYGLEPETRVRFLSPWDLFATKETLYECGKCKKQFWYTKGDMEIQKSNEQFYQSLTPPTYD